MNPDELRATLKQLHTELADADEIDTESLELVQKVTADVDRIVSGKNQPKTGEDDTEPSYSDQLRGMVSTFETRHPVVSGLLERLSDGLANLGI